MVGEREDSGEEGKPDGRVLLGGSGSGGIR